MDVENDKLYTVAVNAPLWEPLTYCSDQPLMTGTSVEITLGKRKAAGVVLDKVTPDENPAFKIKHVVGVSEFRPALPEKHIQWIKWLSQYYMHPLGQVMESSFAPLKPATKIRKSNRKPVLPDVEVSTPPHLTDEQRTCLTEIKKDFNSFGAHLVFGVTGSGKTEVYLHLIDELIKSGKQALVLVPEISLTPQLVERFAARFPGQIAVLHSGLTDRERTNMWWSAFKKEKNILIGARSAAFCPLDLGIVIVDEEHDGSFKQDEKLKYNGRDAAIMLAKIHNCPIVLGSATPSLETWQNTESGKYKLHVMKNRVEGRKLPFVHVVNLKDERSSRREKKIEDKTKADSPLPFWLGEDLYKAIDATLIKKEQCALFLNRRGMSQTVQCQDCGYVYECPNCAISLTLHFNKNLTCHYCDYGITLKDHCLSCHEPSVTPLGIGTERVEEDIQKLFPEARVARADRDEINSREDLEELIKSMEMGEIDILVGTQMIAKGLDFPKLTLVGLVMADVGFNMPDFRAGERSFQLITQVSGRAGRHSKEPGNVYIQTYNPNHSSIEYATHADFVGFAKNELEFRKDFSYPPYGRLACFRIQSMHLDKVKRTSQLLKARADALKDKFEVYKEIILLGPSPAPIEKIRNKYRYHLLAKGQKQNVLNKFCHHLMQDHKWIPNGSKVMVDIDPLNML